MEKNYQKYQTYKSSMEQINAAIEAGFFLEAITIEESILTDRLFRFCKNHGYKKSFNDSTLGQELGFIRDKKLDQIEELSFRFLNELKKFKDDRNFCLHQIAKSEPGTPTQDYAETMRLAKKTAKDGKQLVNKVSKWATKYKKMTENS
jgi:hypothetical protein